MLPYGAPLNGTRNLPDSDLDQLSRLKALSWLSATELDLLAAALAIANFKPLQTILHETTLASDAHILLKGIARVTCQNARGGRVTIALLPPGPIPEFPSLPLGRFDFRCEAYNDCRVGSLAWNDFKRINRTKSNHTPRSSRSFTSTSPLYTRTPDGRTPTMNLPIDTDTYLPRTRVIATATGTLSSPRGAPWLD
jgi:hypothetical protein